MKRAVLLLLSMLMLHGLVRAQNIYVHTIDGLTHTYGLIDVNSITFEDNVMELNLVSNDTIRWNISVVDYYEYDQWYVSVEEGLILDELGLTIYPNPTADRLNLTYNLTSSADVRVKVMDMNGKAVAQLFNGKQNSGPQSLGWNARTGSGLSDGIYIIQLEIGDARFNKLMVLNH